MKNRISCFFIILFLVFSPDVHAQLTKHKFLPFLDLYVGLGNAELSIKSNPGFEGYEKTDKLGFFIGGAIGLRSLSLGLEYSEKSFDVKPPASVHQYGIDTAKQEVKLSYISFPLTYDLLKIVIQNYFTLNLSIGPMFSFLISKEENAGLGIKNFNFSANGKLWGSIPLNKNASLNAGIRLNYGGINNLGKTQVVSKVTTSQIAFWGGIRITL